MRRLTSVLAACAMLAATPAWAGWVIDEVVKGGADDKGRQRLFLQANRLKIVTFEGTQTTEATVLDLEAQTITSIDYKARSYTTATAKEYAEVMRAGLQQMGEALGGQQNAILKEMQESMKDMDPEMKNMVEGMMRPAGQEAKKQAAAAPRLTAADCAPDKVDIKSTGKRATVAGYDATGYQIFTNGTLDSEVFIAPAITAVREIDPQKLERLVTEMTRALPQCPPRGQVFGADPVWKLMKNGYPVRSSESNGGSVTEVVKAESRSIGAGEFQPPAGFARKSLKELMEGK